MQGTTAERSMCIYKSSFGSDLIRVFWFEPKEMEGDECFAAVFRTPRGGAELQVVPIGAIEKVPTKSEKVVPIGTGLFYLGR